MTESVISPLPSPGIDPGPAPIDLPDLIERCGGDRGFVSELFDLCLTSVPETLQRLDETAASGDWPGLAAESHGLKGTARTIAAEGLALACEALERAAWLADPEAAQLGLAAVGETWTRDRAEMIRFQGEMT